MSDKADSITVTEFHRWHQEQRPFAILDVREPWELEICSFPDAITIPLRHLPARVQELSAETPLVVVCHHGMRSQQAVEWLRENGVSVAVNLSGGIDAWARIIDRSMGVY
jgi:rhodanese-related sulfurtransferase